MRAIAVLLLAALALVASVQAADPAASTSASRETAAAAAAVVSPPQASTPAATAVPATPAKSAAPASSSSSSSKANPSVPATQPQPSGRAPAGAAKAFTIGSEAEEVVVFLDELMGLAQSKTQHHYKPSKQQKHPALTWEEQDAKADEDRHAARGRRSSEEHRAAADGSRHSSQGGNSWDASGSPHGRDPRPYQEYEREAEARQYEREYMPRRGDYWQYERPVEQPRPVSVCLQEDQRDNCWSGPDGEHFRSRVHCCQHNRAGAASSAGVQVAGRSELVHPWGADHACSWDFRPFKAPVPVNAITMQTGTAVAHCTFAKAAAVCGEPFEDGATLTIEADTFTMRAVSRPPLATERVSSCAAADKPSTTPGKLQTAAASEGALAGAAAAAAAQPASASSSSQGRATSAKPARSDRVQWVRAASKQARKQQAAVNSYRGQYIKRYGAPHNNQQYAQQQEKPYPWLANNAGGHKQPNAKDNEPYYDESESDYNEWPTPPPPPPYNATKPYYPGDEEESEDPLFFPSYGGSSGNATGDGYYHHHGDEFAPEEEDDWFFPGAERHYLKHSEVREGYKGYREAPEHHYSKAPEAPYKKAPEHHYKPEPETPYKHAPEDPYKKAPEHHYKKAPEHHYKQEPETPYKHAPEDPYKKAPEGHYKQEPEAPYKKAPEHHYKPEPETPYKQEPDTYLTSPYPGYSGTGSGHSHKEEEAAVEDGMYLGWADVYVGRVVAARGLRQGLSGQGSVQYVASFHHGERITAALLRADPEYEALPFMKAGELSIELQP